MVGLKCLRVVVDRYGVFTGFVESRPRTACSGEQVGGESLAGVATARAPLGEGLVGAAVKMVVQLQIVAAQQLHTGGGQRQFLLTSAAQINGCRDPLTSVDQRRRGSAQCTRSSSPVH